MLLSATPDCTYTRFSPPDHITMTGHGEVSEEGQVCQVCQTCADLERREGTEAALQGTGVPGLSKPRRPGTERGHGSSSTRGRCARSVKTPQTWNGERPQKTLWQGQAFQICKKFADLERGPAAENALARASVPGLLKLRRPGTGRGRRKRSGRGKRSKSAKNSQIWNGERPRKQLYEGQACQVCQKLADLERRPAQ